MNDRDDSLAQPSPLKAVRSVMVPGAFQQPIMADGQLSEIAALKAELTELREELRVGNQMYAELTDKCRDTEHERSTAMTSAAKLADWNTRLTAGLTELRELSRALVRATRRSLQGEATVSAAEEAADDVERALE